MLNYKFFFLIEKLNKAYLTNYLFVWDKNDNFNFPKNSFIKFFGSISIFYNFFNRINCGVLHLMVQNREFEAGKFGFCMILIILTILYTKKCDCY